MVNELNEKTCARCIVNYCYPFRTLDLIKDRETNTEGSGVGKVDSDLQPPVLRALAIAKQLFFDSLPCLIRLCKCR